MVTRLRSRASATSKAEGPTVVIVNPASAGGRTRTRWTALRSALAAADISYDVHFTGAPGDATSATRDALQSGAQRIVAVGGDGTLNEVVNGYFDDNGAAINSDAQLAVLPSGTGGDFRKTTGIPLDPAASVAILAKGRTRAVDLGVIEYGDGGRRFFINIADCGLGGDVVARVNRNRLKGGGSRGTAVFLFESLVALMTYGSRDVELTVDGKLLKRSVQNVVIANGRFFGGGMKVAPEAEIDDGVLELVILNATSRLQSLRGVPKVYNGSHLSMASVETMRVREVVITPQDKRPLLFDVEGEQIGQAPATVRCLPGAIRLCVPG